MLYEQVEKKEKEACGQRCIAIMRCGKEADDEQTAEKESI